MKKKPGENGGHQNQNGKRASRSKGGIKKVCRKKKVTPRRKDKCFREGKLSNIPFLNYFKTIRREKWYLENLPDEQAEMEAACKWANMTEKQRSKFTKKAQEAAKG